MTEPEKATNENQAEYRHQEMMEKLNNILTAINNVNTSIETLIGDIRNGHWR